MKRLTGILFAICMVAIFSAGTALAANLDDCTSGATSGCYYYDEINTQLHDQDCDCIPEINRHGIHIDNCAPDGIRPDEDFYNPEQIDSDGDGKGDVCSDTDEDGIMDDTDNCLDIPNFDQLDTDSDGIGDLCEDTDNDGILDTEDNCPTDSNTSQHDYDEDGVGDPCDNCPIVENPSQLDSDNDTRGDACSNDDDGDGITDTADNCPVRFNPDQDDFDGDTVGDLCDNCMDTANKDQTDSDSDGLGDACEVLPDPNEGLPQPYNYGDGGCSLISSGSDVGVYTSLILLAISLAPLAIRRKRAK